MKKIEAVIQARLLHDATALLSRFGATLVAASEVMRFDEHQPRLGSYRGTAYRLPFVGEVKLEILVDDAKAAGALDALRELVTSDDGARENVWVSSVGRDVEPRESSTAPLLRHAMAS